MAKVSWIKVWPRGHHNPSDAVVWKGDAYILKAGTADDVEIKTSKDMMFVDSHNSRMGYRGAERFIKDEGDEIEVEVYRSKKGLPFKEGDRIAVRGSESDVFFDGDDYAEVEDMSTNKFLDHASQWW